MTTIEDLSKAPFSGFVLIGYCVLMLILVIVCVSSCGSEGMTEVPFDYGIGQRRDVLLTHTGADTRSLSGKMKDAASRNKEGMRRERLVGSFGAAPVFHDGGKYNVEGSRRDGVVEPGRAEGMIEAELLEQFEEPLEAFSDEDLARQTDGYRASRF